jgi:spore maturation protein CgeB
MVRTFGASRINLNLSSAFDPPEPLPLRLLRPFRGRREGRRSQIKGRTFEVPGSGGFLLTDHVAYLEDYLTPGEEIGVFEDADDLVAQVGWWLEHEEDRARAANAGYKRVREEHTYDHRFAEIFDRIGVG